MDVLTNPDVLRILAVEDSPTIIERLESILDEVSGVRFVGHATSVKDALVAIEQQHPDVLLLDIRLGDDEEKSGLELLSVVKQKYPAIAVVMLTNLSGPRYRSLCESKGAEFFLDKSEDFEKIPGTLSKIKNRGINGRVSNDD